MPASNLDTPSSAPSGPRPALDAKLTLARCFSAWERALGLSDREGAREAAAPIEAVLDAVDACDPRLVQLRLWLAEDLLRSGQAEAAWKRLSDVERRSGQSGRSRHLAARIRHFANDPAGCARLCAEAVVLATPGGPEHEQICRLWGDALCLMGEPERARQVLERVFAGREPSSAHMRALRQTVRDEGALQTFCAWLSPYFHRADAQGAAALYHYGMACRDLGLHEAGIAAIRRRLLTTVERETFGAKAAPAKAASWTHDAAVALADLKRVIDPTGERFFLISGTLLGCVREGGILGHDKDIDVGVMDSGDAARDAVHAALRESGVFLVRPYEKPTLLRVQHASGVAVDIFWHRLEDGRVIHEGMKSKWWNTPFDLVRATFLGQDHWVPDDCPRYLGENYGDWEKPDPDFETFADTPNMIVVSAPEMIWYCYAKLLDYYALGRAAQFRKIFHQLLRVRPDDEAVRRLGYRVLESLGDGPATADRAQ